MNIHHRNLQKLVTKIFKVKNGLSPELMNIFEFIEKPYSLRATSHFRSRKIRTTKYDTETPSYLVPNEHKTIESLADFKVKIKTWVSRELSLQVIQNIYSPSSFYLISPHDNLHFSIDI